MSLSKLDLMNKKTGLILMLFLGSLTLILGGIGFRKTPEFSDAILFAVGSLIATYSAHKFFNLPKT